MTEGDLLGRWYDALTLVTKEAGAAHRAALGGETHSAYDGRGLHVFSDAYGQMSAFLSLLGPDYSELLYATPYELRDACRAAAAEEYEAEREREWRTRMFMERRVPA